MPVKPITDERLGVLTDALLRNPDLQAEGHWIAKDVYLTRDELINLVATAVVVEHECIMYGLEDMGGNHAQVLLRHIAGSRAMVEGAKDGTIEALRLKIKRLEAGPGFVMERPETRRKAKR